MNVKVVENSVNSQVGRVIVVKVMIQYSRPGMTLRTASITRPKSPKVEGDAISAARKASTDDCAASVALASNAELCAAELIASLTAMVENVRGARCLFYRMFKEDSPPMYQEHRR